MSRMWVASFLVAVMMLHGCGGSSPDGSGGTPPPVLDAQNDLVIREGILPEFVNDPPSVPMDRVRHGSGLPTSSRIAAGGGHRAGGGHSLAVDDWGRLWAWGPNEIGQLGDGTNTSRRAPVAVDVSALGGAAVFSVAAGVGHSLAVDDEGRLWAWGSNFSGELGDGTNTSRRTPVAVDLSALGGAAVFSVAARFAHSLAVDDEGRLWAWGGNLHGRLGDGTVTDRWAPVAVDLSALDGARVVSVAAGDAHTLALDDHGRLWAWGVNSYGELGDGTYDFRTTPVAVDLSALGGTEVVAVAAGETYSLALDDQGRLWAWGSNFSFHSNWYGQLGDGTDVLSRRIPVAVDLSALGGAKVVAVAAADGHNLALDDQGRLWAWGVNLYGQLGDGTDTNRASPIAVDLSALGGTEVVAIAASAQRSLALDDQGRLWAWGRNRSGQLGDGTTTNRLIPVAVDYHPTLDDL